MSKKPSKELIRAEIRAMSLTGRYVYFKASKVAMKFSFSQGLTPNKLYRIRSTFGRAMTDHNSYGAVIADDEGFCIHILLGKGANCAHLGQLKNSHWIVKREPSTRAKTKTKGDKSNVLKN